MWRDPWGRRVVGLLEGDIQDVPEEQLEALGLQGLENAALEKALNSLPRQARPPLPFYPYGEEATQEKWTLGPTPWRGWRPWGGRPCRRRSMAADLKALMTYYREGKIIGFGRREKRVLKLLYRRALRRKGERELRKRVEEET